MPSITSKEAARLGLIPSGGKPSKYRARKTAYNGITYDSAAEARRAQELDALIEAGQVRWYVRQPTFRLGCPENVYRADFIVCYPGGGCQVEDVKGYRTAKFKRDIKLWRRYGPMMLMLKTWRRGEWRDEVVMVIKE